MMVLLLLAKACNPGKRTTDYDGCLGGSEEPRCWVLYVPEDVGDAPPLVLDLHGHKSDAAEQRALSGGETRSETEGAPQAERARRLAVHDLDVDAVQALWLVCSTARSRE